VSGLQSAERRNKKRLQNSFKRVDRLCRAYIRRELSPGGGTCYGVGGRWASDEIAMGGGRCGSIELNRTFMNKNVLKHIESMSLNSELNSQQ